MSATVVKFDFDQYPENVATSTNEGLIIKLSADESYFAGTNYEGLNVKYLIFCPRFYGVCASFIFLCYVKVTREIQNWTGGYVPWNNNFDYSPIQKEIFFDNFYNQTSSSVGNYRLLNFLKRNKFFKSADGSQIVESHDYDSFGFQFANKDGVVNNKIYVPRLKQNTTVYPCYYYNYYIPSSGQLVRHVYRGFQPLFDFPNTTIDKDAPSIYEACVAQPSSLSDRMKQIFPNSWLQ